MASSARKKMESIEVKMDFTPMIDVTFLLLIYFVVTSKFKSSEGNIMAFLPKDRGLGTSSAQAVTETRVKLSWVNGSTGKPTEEKDPDGRCMLKVGQVAFGEVHYRDDLIPSPDFQELRDFLVKAKTEWKAPSTMTDTSKGMPVIIDARPDVPWVFIVRSLNACLEAGIQDVTFAANENPID